MRLIDCRPLANTPASEQIARHADNRFGAALSSIYGFWLAREGFQRSALAANHQDAYTVIAFDHDVAVRFFATTSTGLTSGIGCML